MVTMLIFMDRSRSESTGWRLPNPVSYPAHLLLDGPLEFVSACGHGRSYGIESKLFGRRLIGITQCGMWDALDRTFIETRSGRIGVWRPAMECGAVVREGGFFEIKRTGRLARKALAARDW